MFVVEGEALLPNTRNEQNRKMERKQNKYSELAAASRAWRVSELAS
jgi:hypothetical protein